MDKLNSNQIFDLKNAWQGVNECQNCSIRASALFADLNQEDFTKIHKPIEGLSFSIGEIIYAQADCATSIFTLKKGFIKLLLLNADGSERIVRIVRPGDLFGIEALTANQYDHSAIALESVDLCRIPASEIKQLADFSPRLNGQIMKKMRDVLYESQTWFPEINTGRADLRVARFLLKFKGLVNGSIVAPLFERRDMGLMMDLKFETVSRSLSSLANQGLIDTLTKHSVHIPSIENLEKFCLFSE